MGRELPARVLIIDDSLTVRRYYRSIAKKVGIGSVEAINGVEGLERGLSQPFGLVLVDLNMPTMDGYSFLRAARHQPGLAGVPIIMISTSAQPESRRRAFAEGANFYQTKHVDAHWLGRVMTLLMREAPNV